MINAVHDVHKFCDEMDKISRNLNQKGLSTDEKKKLQEQRKNLLKNLHRSVDDLRDTFIKETTNKGFGQVSMNELVESSKAIGRYLSYEIKINKIRRFLDGFRQIEAEKKYDPQFVVLLRPKLAYAVGRSDRDEKDFMQRFLDCLDPMLKVISENGSKDYFEKGLKFMESIIAYHRYYGGEN